VIERWIRRLLALAPHDFRRKYADELLATYAERQRAAAARGDRLFFQLRELGGAALLVARLRLGLEGVPRAGRVPPAELAWWRASLQDARFAIRTLRRSPKFSLTAVLVLALGIGATSAIFSALNAYFLAPLPFADADRLVTVYETNPEFGWTDNTAAPANLLDWQDQVEAFSDVSGYLEFTDQVTAIRNGEPSVLTANGVVGNFFTTLGTRPALGRAFTMEETWRGTGELAVISHSLWVGYFGGDPQVIGKTLELAGGPREIVGVMPEGFRFPDDDTQLWYPVGWSAEDREAVSFRRAHYLRAFARLAPGVTPEQADASLQTVVRRLQLEYPETNRVMGAGIMPLREFLTREVRAILGVLLGAVLALLLLACANVANLQLVRASERTRELTLRRVLGAGRVRLVRQMLFESAALAGVGGALGLTLGWAGVRSIDRFVRIGINGATALALDWRIVLLTLGSAGLSAILFGVVPALHAAMGASRGAIPERSRGASTSREHLRVAGTLVSAQVALALLLAAGAGLMVRSFWLLGRVDPGFRTDGVLAVQFSVPSTRYPERDQVLSFYDRFAEALEAREGIERVGTVARLPLDGTSWSSQVKADGWPQDRVGLQILHRRADRGYFETLEIPLIRGRLLEPTDRPGQPLAVVVNETFAREYFPDEDPIGRRLAYTRTPGPETTWYEIVGVVGDQQQEHLARPALAEVFESRSQDWGRSSWVVIRGNGDPIERVAVVRDVLKELDPLIALSNVRSLESVRDTSIAQEQLALRLLIAFGATALLLATVGVYAVTSRAARRRTREIGIRMALGAGAPDVLRMMLRNGLSVIVVGLAIGLAASLLATRALASLLYGIEPTDPLTLAAVIGLLGGVALLACYVPARRATSIDPLESLKAE
jgi:putative ABC transport system permease protein